MSGLRIALLGPPQIRLDGAVIETDRHKAIGLLAYLATERKVHSRETLAALLWPDYPRQSAFSYLRRTLWELNHLLGRGWIEAGRESVALADLPNIETDVQLFQDSMKTSGNQVDQLVESIGLYRGDFMEGLIIADTEPFQAWQLEQAAYYRGEFMLLLEKLVTALDARGEYERALPYAQRWLSLDRLNEPAYRAVMRQLAGLGDRSGVVKTYQACVQTLGDELGVSPQKETEALYQAFIKSEPSDFLQGELEQVVDSGPAKSAGNLPSPATPLIGRKDEVYQVRSLILNPDVHLLTLTGPGGTGKTRLSIQVAAELDGNFPDGTWFIPLAAVQSVHALVIAIAKCLDYSFFVGEEPARQQLLDYLRQKHMLLVLDNFEHLLQGGRELLVDLLNAAPQVKLLVTSRERLNLRAEQVYVVPGLSIPENQAMSAWEHPEEQAQSYSAILLLLERARRVRPDFQLTRENLGAILHICQLLEGSPLGIELAVSWLEVLPVEEIDREISHSLDFLESAAADAPARQHSLRAVFETSWKLLEVHEQQAFRRLCVFRGSFSRQAALRVSEASIQTLLNLANKSWLEQVEGGRYQLHEVLRQYGIDLLQADQAEWQATHDRYAEFFADLMQMQERGLQSAGQIQALQELEIEFESNIPAAWEWLVWTERFDVIIEKMLLCLFHYWLIRSGKDDFITMVKHARQAIHTSEERVNLLRSAILEAAETEFELVWAVHDDQPIERIKSLWRRVEDSDLESQMGLWYTILVTTYGNFVNFEEAVQRFEIVLQKMGDIKNPWELGYTYLLASHFRTAESMDVKKTYLLQALNLFKEVGVVHELGITLHNLAELAARIPDYEQAISYAQSAVGYLEQVEDVWGVNQARMALAEHYIYAGKIQQAFHVYNVTRQFTEKVGNRRILGIELSWESMAASRFGSLERALEQRKRSQEIAVEVGSQYDLAWHTWELGEVYRLMGEIQQAKRYYQEAYPIFEKMQDYPGCGFYHRGMGDIAIMQENWLEARREFEQALEYQARDQRNLTAWALAYYHSRLSIALIKLGELEQARTHLKASLTQADNWHNPDIKSLPLVGLANLLLETGDPGEAFNLADCVARASTTWNEVKNQARSIMDVARGSMLNSRGASEPEGAGCPDVTQLVRDYLKSPYLDSKPQ